MKITDNKVVIYQDFSFISFITNYTFTDHAFYSQNINSCMLLSQNCIIFIDINYYPGVYILNYGTGCVSETFTVFRST